MTDKATDKIKEQCLEAILSVIPTGQFIFVLAMVVILFRIDNNAAMSPLLALKDVGIKDLVGFDKGQFWTISALYILSAFFLALLNDALFRLGLKRSYQASQVSKKIESWMRESVTAMNQADKDLRTSIHDSISKELEKRISRYRSKRLLCEMSVSLGLSLVYGSAYVCLRNLHSYNLVGFAAIDFLVIAFCLSVGWAYHRESIRYAIRKIIPLQVYVNASTGELAFFIDVE